jgi:hypothetical protein
VDGAEAGCDLRVAAIAAEEGAGLVARGLEGGGGGAAGEAVRETAAKGALKLFPALNVGSR